MKKPTENFEKNGKMYGITIFGKMIYLYIYVGNENSHVLKKIVLNILISYI